MARPRDLQEIVVEADRPETERDEKHRPNIEIAEIGPEKGRDENAREDHETAHGRRSLLLEDMPLGTIAPDRLAAALLDFEERNDPRTAEPNEQESGQDGRAGPYRLIPEHVEDREI